MKGYTAFIWCTIGQMTNFHAMLRKLLVHVRALSIFLLCIYHPKIWILSIVTNFPVVISLFEKYRVTTTDALSQHLQFCDSVKCKENVQKVDLYLSEMTTHSAWIWKPVQRATESMRRGFIHSQSGSRHGCQVRRKKSTWNGTAAICFWGRDAVSILPVSGTP